MKFKDVKVGDKLFSSQLGECEVTQIRDSAMPIKVENRATGYGQSYNFEGHYLVGDKLPALFFSRPEIIDTPPPKKATSLSNSSLQEFFNKIVHGDAAHRAWLKNEFENYWSVKIEIDVPKARVKKTMWLAATMNYASGDKHLFSQLFSSFKEAKKEISNFIGAYPIEVECEGE